MGNVLGIIVTSVLVTTIVSAFLIPINKTTQQKETAIGTFDGCTVKYIWNGGKSNSFYIAKCKGDSTTITHTDPNNPAPTISQD